MPATTSAYRRFEAGGILTANDGTSTWTLTSVEAGTFEWDFGGVTPLPFTERDVQQMPYKGRQRSGRLAFKAKYAGAQAANDLALVLQRQDSAIATMLAWTIVAKLPTVPFGATGEQLSFASCYLVEGSLKYRSGIEYDMIEAEFNYLGMAPTPTTY